MIDLLHTIEVCTSTKPFLFRMEKKIYYAWFFDSYTVFYSSCNFQFVYALQVCA